MEGFPKRIFILLIAVLIIFIILMNVIPLQNPSSQTQQHSSAAAKVQLRFASNWSGTDARMNVLRKILDRFSKGNPDIEVVNESLSGDYFIRKLMVDFASGNAPDVFCLWSGSDVNKLVSAGRIAQLDQILQEDENWKMSFKGDAWKYVTNDDKIYGIPFESFMQCLFINKDLFEKYNIPIPRDFDELKYAVLAFRNERIIPIAYSSDLAGPLLYQNFIAKLGSKEEIEHPIKDGKINPSYIKAMHYMKDLYQLGAFPWEAFILDNDGSIDMFINKKAAMIPQASWFVGTFLDKDSTVDIIPFPSMNQEEDASSTLIYGSGSGNFYISKAAWNDKNKKNASVKLLKTLTSKESAVEFIEYAGMLVNIQIPESSIKYSRLTKKEQDLLHNAKKLVGPPDSFIDRSVWEDIILKQLPYVLDGNKDGKPVEPESIWKEAEKQLEK